MQTTSTVQPKIVHKLIIRFAIGLFLVAGLLAGYLYLRGQEDVDLPLAYDSKGHIAAIQTVGDGSQAVIITPDGNVIPSPDYVADARDTDLAWRPDGNRLFFTSDRDERVFHLYRWNPGGAKVERRTLGTLGFGSPSFASSTIEEAVNPLAVSAGRVVEIDPSKGSVEQILPPMMDREGQESEEGRVEESPFERFYKGIGSSFKSAKWVKGRRYIAAVMRGDEAETLVLQPMDRLPNGQMAPPSILGIGERVEFDVNADAGIVVFTINHPRPTLKSEITQEDWTSGRIEQLKKGFNDPTKHMLGIVNIDLQRGGPILRSIDDKDALTSPSISPDGTTLVVCVGKYEGDGNFTHEFLYTYAAQVGAGQTVRELIAGDARDPSWSPDGNKIVYVKALEDGTREIRTVNVDGSEDKAIASGKGDFIKPVFSPQT